MPVIKYNLLLQITASFIYYFSFKNTVFVPPFGESLKFSIFFTISLYVFIKILYNVITASICNKYMYFHYVKFKHPLPSLSFSGAIIHLNLSFPSPIKSSKTNLVFGARLVTPSLPGFHKIFQSFRDDI